jgi:hypothetical protein
MCNLVLESQVVANLVLFLGKAVRARFYISSCSSHIIFIYLCILYLYLRETSKDFILPRNRDFDRKKKYSSTTSLISYLKI